MTHRDKEQARALEYARSQGWRPPEKVHDDEVLRADWRDYDRDRIDALVRGQQVAVDALEKANVALAAERESHTVTKRAVLRGTKARCVALEASLRWVLSEYLANSGLPPNEEERAGIAVAEALLK